MEVLAITTYKYVLVKDFILTINIVSGLINLLDTLSSLINKGCKYYSSRIQYNDKRIKEADKHRQAKQFWGNVYYPTLAI